MTAADVSDVCAQVLRDSGPRSQPALGRGADHGAGRAGAEGVPPRGPADRQQHSVLPRPLLHVPHFHSDAHQPAQ